MFTVLFRMIVYCAVILLLVIQISCTIELKEIAKDSENQTKKPSCTPNTIHTLNGTTCICNSKGHWPHAQCEEVFKYWPNNKTTDTCEPNTYAIIDCNVCRCGINGKVDTQRCTKNDCNEVIEPPKSRRTTATNNVYGSCIEKTWYSLAPCQFCFCVTQNKMVCNTGHYYAKKLDLGTYNLSVCGKDLIKEAIELIPESEKNLRYGDVKENIGFPTTPKETSTLKHTYVSQINDDVIDTNRGKNKDMKNKNSNEKDKDEYYSDSDEDEHEKVFKNILSNNKASTQYLYQNGDAEDSNRGKNEESDKQEEKEDDSDNEIGVEIEQSAIRQLTSKKPLQYVSPKPVLQKLSEPSNMSQKLGETLKINFPMVLDTMFKMAALRKSMLSLSSDTSCIAGTTKRTKCNTCFCLKNNKLLCTNNVCE